MAPVTIVPNPEKKMISLSIGDPTVFGNLLPAKEVVDAVHAALDSQKCNGYGPSTGSVEARAAVAEHVSVPGGEVTSDDVILCSGCSCALDIAISTLADDGQNILVPRPGFPLYTTLSAGLGIQTREYDLLPDQDWMVDLLHMESLIDHNTAAIIVNSPSNPCGSVFSPAHLRQILDIAERHKVPIIADEIYDNFVFPGETYVPIASLTTTVPVLSCGGLTKRFLVPGWRMGWIVIYDRGHVFDHVGPGGSPHHPCQHSQVLLRRHDQRDPEQRQAGLHQAEGHPRPDAGDAPGRHVHDGQDRSDQVPRLQVRPPVRGETGGRTERLLPPGQVLQLSKLRQDRSHCSGTSASRGLRKDVGVLLIALGCSSSKSSGGPLGRAPVSVRHLRQSPRPLLGRT